MIEAQNNFRHVLDRHGLWEEARYTPPRNEFGPLVNLGVFQLAGWEMYDDAMRFVRRSNRDELATFIALLAAIGEIDVMSVYNAAWNAMQSGRAPLSSGETR